MTQLETPTLQRPKAYSYVRWSTAEQGSGDSLRRQTETARRYAEQHGLELDTELTFQDMGVSAFRGRNAAEGGALAAFQAAVDEGRVLPGSVLIVESLDRISRQKPRKAAKIIEGLVERGITVIDANDGGRVYNDETMNNLETFLMLVLRFERANEESALKQDRLQKAFERKRARVASGEARPWGNLPAWLSRDNDGKIVPSPERAELLRDIFAKADAGWGQHRIAEWLNQRNVPTWGRASYWHRSYIKKLLSNRAVVGTFTPHVIVHVKEGAAERKRRRPLDPLHGRFPAVIEPDLFERVSARAETAQARGRNAGRAPKSIFAGVIKCAHCGGNVIRSAKNAKDIYLVCSRANAKAAGCRYQPVRYDAAVEAVTEGADAILNEAPRGSSTAEIEQQINSLDVIASDIAGDCTALLREKMAGSSTAAQALKTRERDLKEARGQLRELRATQARLADVYVTRRLERMRHALKAEPLDIVETNVALREAVSAVVLDPESARMTLRWRHSDDETYVMVASRHVKLFDEDAPSEEVL